jgi:transposase
MTTKKRTYPAEFKQEAVRLWETSGKSAIEIERELGITHGLLNKWKRQLKNEGQAAFPSRGHLTAEQEQIRQLEYTLTFASRVVEIVDVRGRGVAYVGDEIYVDGGETPVRGIPAIAETMQEEMIARCEGPYWFVGNVVRRVR